MQSFLVTLAAECSHDTLAYKAALLDAFGLQQSLKWCKYLKEHGYEQVFGSPRVSAASRADNVPMH